MDDALPVFASSFDTSIPTLLQDILHLQLLLQQYDVTDEQFYTLPLQEIVFACLQDQSSTTQLEFFSALFSAAVQYDADDLVQSIFTCGRTFYQLHREIAEVTPITADTPSYDGVAPATIVNQTYLIPFYSILNLYDHISTYLHLLEHAYLPTSSREYFEQQTNGLIMRDMYEDFYTVEDKFLPHIELMKQGANLLPDILFYVEREIQALEITCSYFSQLQRDPNTIILNGLDVAVLSRILEFLYPRVGTLEQIDDVFNSAANVVLTVLNEQILNFRLRHESLENAKSKEPGKAQFYTMEQLDNLYFYFYSATVNLYEKYKIQRQGELSVNFQPAEVVGSIYTLTELAFSIREYLSSEDERTVFYENLLDLLTMEVLDQIHFMRYREIILDHLILSGKDLSMQLAVQLKRIASQLNPFEGSAEFIEKYQLILAHIR